MLLTPRYDVHDLARSLVELVGRGTFPMGRYAGGQASCAFLFNELLESDGTGVTYLTWILTADDETYSDVGVFGIRREMTEDGTPTADNVAVVQYQQGWHHFPDVGVAAMPMAVLDAYAARKGWAWSTQEVTDGLAATAGDIDALGDGQHTALVLGHPAAQHDPWPGVAVIRLERRDDVPTLLGSLDPGFVGGPVFVAGPDPASSNEYALLIKCVGVVLPGGATHPVADFGTIRALLRQVRTDGSPPPNQDPRR